MNEELTPFQRGMQKFTSEYMNHNNKMPNQALIKMVQDAIKETLKYKLRCLYDEGRLSDEEYIGLVNGDCEN